MDYSPVTGSLSLVHGSSVVTRGSGVIPLLSEGNYSFTSVTEKVKRYLAHNVLPLYHCKF